MSAGGGSPHADPSRRRRYRTSVPASTGSATSDFAMAQRQKVGALDLLDEMGIVDVVVPERPAAHEDPQRFVRNLVCRCHPRVGDPADPVGRWCGDHIRRLGTLDEVGTTSVDDVHEPANVLAVVGEPHREVTGGQQVVDPEPVQRPAGVGREVAEVPAGHAPAAVLRPRCPGGLAGDNPAISDRHAHDVVTRRRQRRAPPTYAPARPARPRPRPARAAPEVATAAPRCTSAAPRSAKESRSCPDSCELWPLRQRVVCGVGTVNLCTSTGDCARRWLSAGLPRGWRSARRAEPEERRGCPW